MTPQEKAKELYHKFQVYEVNGQRIMKYGPEVKVFTLITVDEVIKNTIITYEDCFNHNHWEGGYDTKSSREAVAYWQEVKQEIEKL